MTFSLIIARRSSMVSFFDANSFSVSDSADFFGSPEAFLTNFLTSVLVCLMSISKSAPNNPSIVISLYLNLIRMRIR